MPEFTVTVQVGNMFSNRRLRIFIPSSWANQAALAEPAAAPRSSSRLSPALGASSSRSTSSSSSSPLSKLSRIARVSVFSGAGTTVQPLPVPAYTRCQSPSLLGFGGEAPPGFKTLTIICRSFTSGSGNTKLPMGVSLASAITMCWRAAGCFAVSRYARPFPPGGVPVSRKSRRKSSRGSESQFASVLFVGFGYFGSQLSWSTSEVENAFSRLLAPAFTAM